MGALVKGELNYWVVSSDAFETLTQGLAKPAPGLWYK